MLRIAVLVSGGGTNLQAIMDSIRDGKIKDAQIVTVISNNAGAYALERAKNYGAEGLLIAPGDYPTREDFNQALLEALLERKIDLVVLAGYLVVVPPCVIHAFENRIINIHPSLIPSFCGTGCYGLHVHEKALARGVKISGATVHFVDEGTDTGPIIMQKAIAVQDDDTPETLQRRIMEEAEWIILPETIGLIAQGKVHVEGRKVTIG
jgi:phosphoribosylglycinamide formyltransferase-1